MKHIIHPFAQELKRIQPEVNEFLKNSEVMKDWKLKSGEHLYLQKNDAKKVVEIRIFEMQVSQHAEPRIETSIPYHKINDQNFFLQVISMSYMTIASFYKVIAEDLVK